MRHEVQPLGASELISSEKIAGGNGELISAHTESNHASDLQASGPGGHFHRRGGAKLPGGVENPANLQAPFGRTVGCLAESREDFFHVELSPKHDTDGKGDFRINDLLANEFVHQAMGGKGKVFRRLKK